MAFELLAMAERRWWQINAPQLVPRVRAGGVFRDETGVERKARVRPPDGSSRPG